VRFGQSGVENRVENLALERATVTVRQRERQGQTKLELELHPSKGLSLSHAALLFRTIFEPDFKPGTTSRKESMRGALSDRA